MAESLGDAVLSLRTDDTAFTGGIENARGKAQELGKVLDLTSGSSLDLAAKLTETGTSGERMAAVFSQAGKAVDELAAAQVNCKTRIDNSKASLDAGTISQEQYNREVIEAKATLAGYEEEHRKAQTELRKTLTATNAVTGATGQQKAGIFQLTQNLSDMTTMWSMGMRPQQIFASQIGQTMTAVQMLGGEGTKLALFLANPWVQGVTMATIVLGPLIAGLFDTGEASDKVGKSTETLSDKLDLSKHSYGEVLKASRELNAEREKSKRSALEEAAEVARNTQENLKNAISLRERLRARYELLRTSSPLSDPNAEMGRLAALNGVASAVEENEKDLRTLMTAARNSVVDVAVEMAKLDSDPTKKLREGFHQMRNDAKATIKDVGDLRRALADIDRQEDAAVKAEQAKSRSTNSGSSASAQANVGDMVALVKQLFPGAHITATTGGTHVKGSDHYAGRAIDFVPAGGMGQYTTAQVEQILRDAGIDIRRNASGREQMFGPGRSASKPGDHDDHFHFAWQGSPSPESAQRRQDQAQRKAEQEAEQAQRNREAFNSDEARLNQQLLQVQEQGLSDVEAIAASQREQVVAEGERTAQAINAAVAAKKYTSAEGQLLLDLAGSITAAKIERIEREKRAEQLKRSTDLQLGLLDNEIDALHTQQGVAKTAADRRRIALQILDYETQAARLKLQETIDLAKLGKATAEQARIAQDALDKLNGAAPAERQKVIEDTAGPLEDYVNRLRKTRGQNGERVQQLVVDELEYVQRNISDAISSKLGIKDPLLKGLIDMFVEQVFIRPMAEALQSATGSLGGGGGGGGLLGSLFGAIGGALLGGGGGAGLDTSDAMSGKFAGFFANGGTIPEGSFGIVGEAGPEPIFAKSGGVGVLPNSALRRMNNGEGSGGAYFDLRGAVMTQDLLDQMNSISRQHVSQGISTYDQHIGERVKDYVARRS